MPRNPVRVGFDPGAPPLDLPAIIEFEGGEEVTLGAIDPGGGYQRSGLEMTYPLATVRQQRQLVNDEVNDVLGNVHLEGSNQRSRARLNATQRGRVGGNRPLIRIQFELLLSRSFHSSPRHSEFSGGHNRGRIVSYPT